MGGCNSKASKEQSWEEQYPQFAGQNAKRKSISPVSPEQQASVTSIEDAIAVASSSPSKEEAQQSPTLSIPNGAIPDTTRKGLGENSGRN